MTVGSRTVILSGGRPNVWEVRIEEVETGQRFQILRDGSNASFREVFSLLETDPEFTSWYTSVLSSSEFESFFWEHPPVSTRNHDSAIEFVLVDGPALAMLRPDPEPFRSQFERDPDEVVAIFPNLGGDAVLVVPRPISPSTAYSHLAAFVRQAPPGQVQRLWHQTGRAVRENLSAESKWLSTAGMGVPWLHIRIDSSPKYYRFGPYKSVAR